MYRFMLFLTSAILDGEWSASRPGPFNLPRWKSPRYPLYRRLGGPKSRFEGCGEEKMLNPPGVQTLTLLPSSRLRYPGSFVCLCRRLVLPWTSFFTCRLTAWTGRLSYSEWSEMQQWTINGFHRHSIHLPTPTHHNFCENAHCRQWTSVVGKSGDCNVDWSVATSHAHSGTFCATGEMMRGWTKSCYDWWHFHMLCVRRQKQTKVYVINTSEHRRGPLLAHHCSSP
jgi:hypothetical protein